MNKQKIIEQSKTTLSLFSKLSLSFKQNISLDEKGPLNPSSEVKQDSFVIVDFFSNYIDTVPTRESETH